MSNPLPHPEITILSAERRVRQGEALLQQGRHDAALAAADAVLLEMPALASAWLLRGAACKALGRLAEAAEAYRFILSLFPDFTQMYINLANVCIALDDLAEAETQLCEAIARNPDSAAAHANLGSLYMRLECFDLAETMTRKALAADPSLIAARQNLAAILALRDDPEADAHRDIAYRRKQLFVETSPGARRTALILASSGSGNVPYLHLLPRARYNHILWHLDYAPPGQEKNLPAHDFVFNAVADPDAAAAAHSAAEHFTYVCARPLLNAPGRVARTVRSQMPALLASIPDAVIPDTRRFARGDGDPGEAIRASGLRFPLIVRPAGRHGGEGVQLVRSAAALEAKLPRCETLYVTEFVDYRSPDSWYRKYRVIFVDREPYPYHLAIGARWLLHYRSADMQTGPARRAEEAAFLRDPSAALGPRAMAALRAIAARLDLDYAGIDFSLLPDGRLLVFEANATMLVHPEEDPLFAYKNTAVDAIVAAVDAMTSRRLEPRPQQFVTQPGFAA